MSEDVISRFKVRHQSIVNTIDHVQAVSRSYMEAKPRIRDFNDKLLHHLSSQNDEFFDELRHCHQADRQALKMIEFLEKDLRDVKVKYLIFSEKHSGEMADTNARTFPANLSHFAVEIINRIKIEEEYLLPLLKKIP